MRLTRYLVVSLVASLGLHAGPLLGQVSQPAQSPQAKKPFDPNEMVCEKQAIPGSRLAFAKVCHTRAEWDDLRAQDRQDLDRAQKQRSIPH